MGCEASKHAGSEQVETRDTKTQPGNKEKPQASSAAKQEHHPRNEQVNGLYHTITQIQLYFLPLGGSKAGKRMEEGLPPYLHAAVRSRH